MTDDTGLSRRRFLQATGGAAAAAALAGCSGNSGNGGGGGNGSTKTKTKGGGADITRGVKKPDKSKTLKLMNSTITSLDPIEVSDTASGRVDRQIHEGLMVYPDGEVAVEKLLAKDYKVSDDYLSYEFTIKDGVKFHNGKELTAKDFVYSWERLAASSHSQRSYFILDSLGIKHKTKTVTKDGEKVKQYVPNSMALEAVDKKTLRFELSKPFHATLSMLAYGSFAAIPEGLVGDVKGYKGKVPHKKFAKSPKGSGTGPFKFEQWTSGSEASVVRNENYHDGEVPIAGIHWQVVKKDAAIYNYFVNKNADSVIRFPTSKYDPEKVNVKKTDKKGRDIGTYGPMRNGETVNYQAITPINTFYIGFNMEKIPKPVRKAFAYVADQNLFVDQAFKNRGTPAYHFTPPGIYPGGPDAAEQHAKKKYPYGFGKDQPVGVQKAKKVMEKAGYGPNNKFTVNWTQYSSKSWLEMAKIFRQRLASAHIKMKIKQTDFSTLVTQGRKGKLDVYTLGWISDWPAPDNFLQLLYPPRTQTEAPDNLSYINWTPGMEGVSAAKDAIEAYETVKNNQAPTKKAQKKRNQAYIKMEEANWEDVGFLNIYNGLQERMYYDWAEMEPFGGMGPSRQELKNVKIGQRNK
jgi:ABC-type transport system substrate-binding protein